MYASLADARAEGITVSQASDDRLRLLIDEASRSIDRMTGWFFEPRQMDVWLDGRGTPTVELPVHPIRLDRLIVNGTDWSTDPDHLVIVGAPIQSTIPVPRLTLRHGLTFPRGHANILATGLWGLTEDDGSPTGRTPLDIRRACLLLVLLHLPLLADTDATADARNQWRLIEERTRDQSYKLSPAPNRQLCSGDPEVDEILARYQRPAGLGAI
jgi:hypothetical protein